MQTKHTPAPWQDDDSGEYVTTARVIRRNGIIICRMECRHPMTREEYNANARLIAEAPAMRERLARMATALSTAASYIARDTDTGIADEFEREANEARALLERVGR